MVQIVNLVSYFCRQIIVDATNWDGALSFTQIAFLLLASRLNIVTPLAKKKLLKENMEKRKKSTQSKQGPPEVCKFQLDKYHDGQIRTLSLSVPILTSTKPAGLTWSRLPSNTGEQGQGRLLQYKPLGRDMLGRRSGMKQKSKTLFPHARSQSFNNSPRSSSPRRRLRTTDVRHKMRLSAVLTVTMTCRLQPDGAPVCPHA